MVVVVGEEEEEEDVVCVEVCVEEEEEEVCVCVEENLFERFIVICTGCVCGRSACCLLMAVTICCNPMSPRLERSDTVT